MMIVCTPVCSGKRLETGWQLEDERTGEVKDQGRIRIDYPYDLGEVPEGILAIPAIGCLMPLAVLYGADIRVPVCDEDFFETLPALRNELWGDNKDPAKKSRIRTKKLQKNIRSFDKKTDGILAFGALVEDYFSLINHASASPDLVQIVDQELIRNHKEEADNLAFLARKCADCFSTACYRIRYLGIPVKDLKPLQEASMLVPLAWLRSKRHILLAEAGRPGFEGTFAPGGRKHVFAAGQEDKEGRSAEGVNILKAAGMQVVLDGRCVSLREKQEAVDAFCRRTGIQLIKASDFPAGALKERASGDQSFPVGYILGVPDHANLGDHQIIESMLRFMKDIDPDLCIREIPLSEYFDKKAMLLKEIGPRDVLLFPGGGFFGNIWPRGDILRRDAFESWPENPKIVFPQSLFYTDDDEGRRFLQEAKKAYTGKNTLLSFRDRVSFGEARRYFGVRMVLAPDIVFYSDKASMYRLHRDGALLLLRDDKEKNITAEDEKKIETELLSRGFEVCRSDMRLPHSVKPAARRVQLDLKLQQIAGSRIVVTDRLHGLIFCAVTETPCVAFGNSYHKIAAAMEWLEDVPYVRMAKSMEDFPEMVEAVLSVREPHYPAGKMAERFCELRDAVQEMLRQ